MKAVCYLSEKTQSLQASTIVGLSEQCRLSGVVNLGQGMSGFSTARLLKKQASRVVAGNNHQYSPSEGLLALRCAIAKKLAHTQQMTVDPDTQVIVTHGATGAYVCAVLTLFNPGDEILLFEPFYPGHKTILEFHGMQVKTIPIHLPNFSIDWEAFQKMITPQTKGLVICTPSNPSGKVFTKRELLMIGKIIAPHPIWVIADEIYENIIDENQTHISFARLENWSSRTVTISGFSKSYSITGWRLGYATGPEMIIQKMALVQELLFVCPVTPLQEALTATLAMEVTVKNYHQAAQKAYIGKRDLLAQVLLDLNFQFASPQGAYYILADFSRMPYFDDAAAVAHLFHHAKVAAVPGREFFVTDRGKKYLRFNFGLSETVLQQAILNLKQYKKAQSKLWAKL